MKQNVKADFHQLISYCQSFAKHLLVEQNEFYPFAAYLDFSGVLRPLIIYDDDEFPLSESVITSLEKQLDHKKREGSLNAYVIAYDAKVTNQTYPESVDAIAIRAVHKDENELVNYYFPYKMLKDEVEVSEGWEEQP
jgi:hypothetical protein